jgi:hypothetical protein
MHKVLFQEGPIESFNYMVAGFAVILGAMGIFVYSLVSRLRKLWREKAMLERIEKHQPD